MGVPKYFRYISERYPCLSETLKSYQIPEFDNFYLDMNGIVHGCSHPNDEDVSFRISEEQIFKNIFRYIEILFHMIQPRKLLFLAIDGVAPRAKINQQRSRRFRTAKDIETQEAKALAKGIPIPTEKRFDSNCITPGTLFMSKLNEHLRYFITYKISTDKLWQRCKIMLSGSEVPGEGEHKIMDYIRYMRAQPDYDINTRHCLYGLDADLIMLGLCTHELHFTLLREEVKFGKQQKKIVTPEETKFCLLHLSLLRDYIDHEFALLKEKLSFPYDIEKIIDDWVLMGFLVGNDFIPNLPNLHIANGALSILYHVYMDVLPTLDGYINEAGTLRLDRFEKFMERLSHLDMVQFSEQYADIKYFESKTGRRPNETERHSYRKSEDTCEQVLPPKKTDDRELEALMRSTLAMTVGEVDDDDAADDESDSDIYNMEFVQHKRDYYMNKLEYENIDEEFLRSQAECYVRAIQWNLNYYYNGCCSWSWYYPHHYAPYISDIKDFKDLKLEFDLGEPFLPFEQLLATLPAYSKNLLPEAFQSLLTEQESPIIDYYPTQFKTDLNGKQNEWEAVVLIPFIKEKNLLDAMAPHYPELTPEERERHKHGPMRLYSYTEEDLGIYKAPEYFPDVKNHSHVQLINREDIIVPRDKLVKGLCRGVQLDVYYPGFPVLRYIQHTASLEKGKVIVFQHPSRKESMILHVTSPVETDLTTVASEFLGKTVFVSWPYLTEAQVIGVSNCDTKLSLINPQMNYCYENVCEEELRGSDIAQWEGQKKHIAEVYKTRLGIDIGETSILIHARPLCGSKYIFGSHGKLYLEKQWSSSQVAYAYQTVVKDISIHCINPTLYKTVTDIFVPGSICFMLGHPHYGALGQVLEPAVCETLSRIRVSMNAAPEPSLETIKQFHAELRTQYMHGSIAAQRLGISSHLLSRITGTIYVRQSSSSEFSQEETKYNVGLNLKFNKKNEEVPGYTRKENGQWLYSMKAVDLIRAYMVKCPDLFELLVKNVNVDIFLEETLFDKGSEELRNTVAWLKQQLHGIESRSCGTETVEAGIVQKLEEEIDAFYETRNDGGKPVLMQIKPHLLFKPGLHLCNSPPDPNAQNYVFDRICCIKESFTVPLGHKGTIIGIQKAEKPLDTMYDVLFDKAFPGGLSINGCSQCRGYRLSVLEFINLSYGERIEKGKSGVTDAAATESVDSWRAASNQKTPSRANASAFASFVEERNLSWRNSSPSPKLRIIKKNHEEAQRNNQVVSDRDSYKRDQRNSQSSWREPHKSIENAHQNASPKNVQKNQPSPVKPATEFQALWDELHQKQKPSGTPKTALPAPPGATVKQINKDISGTSLQDPSAFLKAMLKIPDGSVQPSMQSGRPRMLPANAAPLKDNVMDAPPLVQQLFDHARQNEKVQDNKTPIWYCSQLLNYYQLSRMGMPRYTYFTDEKTNLIQAHILLPDSRIFVGDPCMTHEQAAGSAAKKVYMELNSVNLRPDVKTLLPPSSQWYFGQQNKNWSPQNVHPPVVPIFPPNAQGPPNFPQWTPPPPPMQQNPLGFQQMAMHSNQLKFQSQPNYSEPKSEIKNSTPFVPLQAQKKSTNVAVKQNAKKTNQCAKENPEPVVQQKKKEPFPKTVKAQPASNVHEKITPAQGNVQQSQNTQNTQNTRKPKKSRVAAKFSILSQTEGNHSKDST